MQFFERKYKNELVFLIDSDKIDDFLACQIISKISSKKKVGLDMSKVESIESKILIEYLLDNKIKLYNLQSEVLAYFALIFKDGALKSYVNYFDFKEDKRELVARHFRVA